MHELSICQQLIKQASETAIQNSAERITAIHIKLGPLSGVDSELLKQAFSVASQTGMTQQASLDIQLTSIVVECELCASICDATSNKLRCCQCGSEQTHLISGDELILSSIDIDTSTNVQSGEIEYV